jgi:S-DNA-T family DNA segregation ATPase FtsK/SpoIIIE
MADDVQATISDPPPSLMARLMGAALIPFSLFPVLAMVTYDCRDIAWVHVPASLPPANLMGVVGAWLVFGGYALFGFVLWLLPPTLLLVGLLLAFGHPVRLGRRLLWGIPFFVMVCALIQLAAGTAPLAEWMSALNITPNAGGVVGQWVMTCFLKRWLNPVGGAVVAVTLAVVFGVLAVGFRTLWCAGRWLLLWLQERRIKAREQAERLGREAEVAAKDSAREQVRDAREAARALREQDRLAKQQKDEESRRAFDERKRVQAEERLSPTPPPENDLRDQMAAMHEAAQREQRAAVGAVPPVADADGEADEPDLQPEPYRLPPVDLLSPVPDDSPTLGDMEQTAANLIAKFKEFNIQIEVTNIIPGPVVTQYEVLPGPGVRVERIAAEVRNLQLALGAASLRVQAPIPNKKVCGIEVPNLVAQKVTLRQVLESEKWKKGTYALPLAMGKDVVGNDLVLDLATLPHMLVAGQTGSGKSVCLNAILVGLLMSRTPEELRLILVDPKRVEFPPYNDLPHLLVPVITDPKKVAYSLRWALGEMDKRLKMFQAAKTRNIAAFNARTVVQQDDLFASGSAALPADDGFPRRLPHIVIVIDEMADLMSTVGKEIEASISRLAAVSRAAGIHMILATQRPSVDVLTGTIKANIPGRVAFQVAQRNDSRIILDAQGAESLIGKGDMIFLDAKLGQMRVQGAWVNDDEIARVVTFVKEHSHPAFDDSFLSKLGKVRELGADDHEEDEDDADGGPTGAERSGEGEGVAEEDGDEVMVREAMRVIRDTRRASTSTLQRRLRIGFTRAGRIMDLLEERGIIGPPQGVAPRDILVDLDAGYVHTDGSSESPIKTEETDEGALEPNADEPPDGSKDAGSGQK